MFFIAEFERTAKIRKITVYRFLISLLVPELQRFKEERNQSKSIKFVTSYAGNVDGMKKWIDNKTPQGAAISVQLVTEKQLCRPKGLWSFYLTWAIEAMDW